MNNRELIERVAAESGTGKAEAKKIIDALFGAILDTIEKGEEVAISGFGKFKLKESAARQGRNPSTGQAIQIAAARKLTFAPAKAAKDRLNG